MRPSRPPRMSPSTTEDTEINSEARAPQMTRAIMSWPVPSVPMGWANEMASVSWPMKCWSGAGTGSTGASSADSVTSASQTIATQPNRPSRFDALFSTLASVSVGGSSMTSDWVPATTGSCSTVGAGLGDCSGMADPRVEDGVEDVDEEVHDHVADREDRDVTLQCNVLATEDGVGDQESHAVDHEDVLDHDRAADERADVEASHSEQRQARRPQRVPPQDPGRAEALRPRHRDEVLLQCRDHVAAQQAHVDRDLADGEADRGERGLLDVADGVVPPRDPAGRLDPTELAPDVVREHEAEHEVGDGEQREGRGVDALVEQ